TELAPAATAGRRGATTAAAGRPVLDELSLGRDDVPLAAVEVLPLAVGLACSGITRVRVERPLVVRHDLAAGGILVPAEQLALRGAAGLRLVRALPLQRGPEARAGARARDVPPLVLHEDVERPALRADEHDAESFDPVRLHGRRGRRVLRAGDAAPRRR